MLLRHPGVIPEHVFMQSLLVFSHTRWDIVFQRPQHLMTRLGCDYRVFFFEPPVFDDKGVWLEISEPAPNVHVCRPHTPQGEPGFADAQIADLQRLLDRLVSSHELGTPVVWLCTSMALPLVQRLEPSCIVYDCTDGFATTADAPRELQLREHAVLKLADLVFTAGRSVFRAKQALHDNVHCLPSSVEREHFARARDADIDHELQRALPHPRFGFFGVVDERLDPVALALLADAHPQWQVVLVGPVRVDPNYLPRRANIHYLGQQPYAELPRFVAGWDVCLLPFVVNAQTRYMSPTKVLEYMAAEKPIVSTPVVDVLESYSHVVHVGRHAQAFVGACERALEESAAARERRAGMMRNIVVATSWESTVARMRALIDEVARGQHRKRTHAHAPAKPAQARRVVVIGAGPTGLSTAYHLGEQCLLLEQHRAIGGSCRSRSYRGFTFDLGDPLPPNRDAYVQEMLAMLSGENLQWTRAVDGARAAYPLQGGLQALMDGFLPQLRGEVKLSARVVRIIPGQHQVVLNSGASYVYEKLVCTLPLPELVKMLGDDAPPRVRRAVTALRHQSARRVNLGIAVNATAEFEHSVPRTAVFRRILAPGHLSPRNDPPDGMGLICEIPFSPADPLPVEGEALIDRCIADCIDMGLFAATDSILTRKQVELPYAAVVDDAERAEQVELVRHWLRARDIELAGYFAEWNCVEFQHPFLAGKAAAERVEDGLARKRRSPAPRDVVAQLAEPRVTPDPR
jgi:protoporphyrinogen oxidase/glycosyltransferase involved in cell wall biosynthesis